MIRDRRQRITVSIRCDERGSNLVEYALLATILILMLSQLPSLLYAAAERKAVSTAAMHEEMSPCGGSLSGDECL